MRSLLLISKYTRGTPFPGSELAPGEFLNAFIFYADTLLSINQIAFLLSLFYKTLYERVKETEAAFLRGFPTVWDLFSQTVGGPRQVDEIQQVCSEFKGQDSPRENLDRCGSPEGWRTRWIGEQGDELTLVVACRDVLRVASAEKGTDYEEELGPVIEEAKDLTQPLKDVCTDELPAKEAMDYDHKTVFHDEEYVPKDGVHTSQARGLRSLLQPWLAKFRGLSK